MSAPRKIFALFGDERRGPFAPEDLAREGVGPRTLVWYAGCTDWLPAGEARELEGWVAPPQPPSRGRSGERSSRWADRFVEHQPPPEMHLHQPYRVGSIAFLIGQITLVSCGLLALFAFWLDFMVARDRSLAGMQVMFVGFSILLGIAATISLLVGSIFYLVFLYRCWDAIQDGHVETTPGMAVGLLFVPLFNLYWVFVSIRGLAAKANEYAIRHRLRAPRAPHTLGLAVGMNYALSPICWIGFIGLACNLFVFPVFARSLYRTFRCFTLENRVEETDDHVLHRPMTPSGSLAWGLPAQILAWFAAPALVIGLIATVVIHDELNRGRGRNDEFAFATIIAALGAIGFGVSLLFAHFATQASRNNNEGTDLDRQLSDGYDQRPRNRT
ncbi:MAG: DUF4339 domain-containing protein [Gemmataceae bacterium]|nr:DUF4339 domain-containing protein [Gemmataceae bacterium]